jgi:hypothetical protein
MAAYANPDRVAGKAAAEKLITTAKSCPVHDIARLGRTLTASRAEFLARFDHPGVSNGPTEYLNLKVKNTKRAARGYRSSLITGCDYFSTTDSSEMIKQLRGSEPADPGSLRRAGSITAVTPSLNRTPFGCLQLMSISIPRAESRKD